MSPNDAVARRESGATDPVSGLPVVRIGRSVTAAEVAAVLDDE